MFVDPAASSSRAPRSSAMHGLLGEHTVFLSEIPSRCPTQAGRRVHLSTALRWVTRGVRGVRLEAVRLGGRWVTSLEALDRFAARLTAADCRPEHGAAAPHQAATRVEEELRRHGL